MIDMLGDWVESWIHIEQLARPRAGETLQVARIRLASGATLVKRFSPAASYGFVLALAFWAAWLYELAKP